MNVTSEFYESFNEAEGLIPVQPFNGGVWIVGWLRVTPILISRLGHGLPVKGLILTLGSMSQMLQDLVLVDNKICFQGGRAENADFIYLDVSKAFDVNDIPWT
nr:4508_t:CDS:2 [Entrophospora candida]